MQRSSNRRILCVSRHYPTPGVSGNCEYLRAVLQGLADSGYIISLLWLDGPCFFRPWFRLPSGSRCYTSLLLGRGLKLGPFVLSTSPRVWLAGGLLILCNRLQPWLPDRWAAGLRRLGRTFEAVLERDRRPLIGNTRTPSAREIRLFRRMLQHLKPGAVLLNYAYLAPLANQARIEGLKSAVLTHDVVHQLHAAMVNCGLRSSAQSSDLEVAQLQEADLIVAIQDEERSALQNMLPDREVRTVQMPQQARHERFPQEAATLLFVGSGTGPNFDGLSWFINSVLPSAKKRIPNLRLHVCGAVCGMFQQAPDSVVLKGVVGNLSREYAMATACIAPLRCGSGLKIKVVEAWAHGRAVVGTSTALQGLGEFRGVCALQADDPMEFVQAVVTLVGDSAMRCDMERMATQKILERFSTASVLQPLLSWFDAVAAGREESACLQSHGRHHQSSSIEHHDS